MMKRYELPDGLKNINYDCTEHTKRIEEVCRNVARIQSIYPNTHVETEYDDKTCIMVVKVVSNDR